MIVISGIHIYLTATATAPSVACSSRVGHASGSRVRHSRCGRRACVPYDTAFLIKLGLQSCSSTRHPFDSERVVVLSNRSQDLLFGNFFFLVDVDARRGPTPMSFSAPKKLTVGFFAFFAFFALLTDFFFGFLRSSDVSARMASSGSSRKLCIEER